MRRPLSLAFVLVLLSPGATGRQAFAQMAGKTGAGAASVGDAASSVNSSVGNGGLSAPQTIRIQSPGLNGGIDASLHPELAVAPSPILPSAAVSPLAVETKLFPAAKSLAAAPSKPALGGSRESAGLNRAAESGEGARADGDAIFDARRLQADDATTLIINGYRFDKATSRILAPGTGEPLTNASARLLRNILLEGRGRGTLLRLAGETGVGGTAERKAALIELNRNALPREVSKAVKIGPGKERATILRRLASLYRRWLQREDSAPGALVSPANAEVEEKLGALIAEAAVKHFTKDPEGVRLLDQLRDERGKLRLPTVRVLSLDARYGALYTNYGRQLILSLNYLKPLLLARLPEAEREEAGKGLMTEEGALSYLSHSPERVAALVEAIDVTLFHELIHFSQDLKRPLMTAVQQGEVPSMLTYEHEYEAYFRQDIYIHSRLSRPDAKPNIDRVDDYLRLIDNFDAWKGAIENGYARDFLNGTVALEELEKLQIGSRRLIERLAGPEKSRAEAASQRLKAAARGSDAIATEKRVVDAELSEYRRRWPTLARDGLRRWAEINERLGRLPQVALAQNRLARLTQSKSEAAAWDVKAERSIGLALQRLSLSSGLSLDERVDWINGSASYFSGRGEPWKKELWVSLFRDYADKASALRAEAAGASEESVRAVLISRAEQFEGALHNIRVDLRSRAESDLASVFSETEAQRRSIVLARGYMEAEVLADAELLAAFKPLASDPTEAGWSRGAAKALDKSLIRLAVGAGLSLDDRLLWINAFSEYFNGRNKPWKKELWVSLFRDYADKARELRAAAAKSPEGSAKSELLRRAEEFEQAIGSSRAVLRADAETNLAALKGSLDPLERASLIDWGSMRAEVLGDAALSAAFKALSGAAANGPRP